MTYKSSISKLEGLISQTETLLRQLHNVSHSQKEQNITKKLQIKFDIISKDYLEEKKNLQYMVKDKKLEKRMQSIPDNQSLQGSMINSVDDSVQILSDLPVL